jgi:His-Xaa-Ser system radical SAM maturase HxsC
MCSQPPVIKDDNSITLEHLRLIELIPNEPEVLGITGGEPTLLGDGLVQIISRLKERIPKTKIHMLTNGRMYAYKNFTKALGEVCHPGFLSAIPLYSDVAAEHDYVVQAKGAFDQTIVGLYNAARFGLETEIRVVLHKQTIPRLVPLMEFIYRNLSFVGHVALMGLENMGYVKKNWNSLWIDPVDYRDTLLAAVRHLCYRGMNVSVYNLPLCILPKTVWPFAQQSISDFKNIYLDECNCCNARKYCAGLFSSSESRHSRGIATIAIEEDELQSIFRPTAVCAA